MSEPLAHLDETGRPCERHPRAELDPILHLAVIGSRMVGFNHDLASKIQGLMMSLDELSELLEPGGSSELERATETAQAAVKELAQLLTLNRGLTKPPVRTRVALREVATRAGERAGVVLRGTLPDVDVELAVSLATQGLALALDAAAGTGRNRSLEAVTSNEASRVELSFPIAPTTNASTSEYLAIAAWVFAREGGELRCSSDARLVLRLPVAG